MKILLIGGLGFLGTALRHKLRARGHDVKVLDIVPGHDSIRCDVAEYRQVKDVFDAHRFELVYHLAAEFGRHNGEEHFETLWKTNVIGTKNIIKMQEQRGFKCVYFSSSEIYGDYDGLMSEDVIPGPLMNDYAMTKWVNEQQIRNLNWEWVIVRPFNIYGAGEVYHRFRSVYSTFIYNLLKRNQIIVYPGHTRSSMYITDFVYPVANIADNFFSGNIYNIGSGVNHTIEELADVCLKYTKRAKNLVSYRKNPEPQTVLKKNVDLRRAKKDLGLKCEISLDRGIRMMAKWMKEYYGL